MRYGSICSGVGGLDRAIEEVFGASPAWFCEYERAPRLVLERHWPGVPILEDVKAVDWSQVEPVELVCAGYPCQPFSQAGKRRGADDPRHLWPFVADAVRVLRPRYVVLENVAGHVALGLDIVLADLAALGFDAEWGVLRASDVGACHQRARLFIVATDARRERHGRGQGPDAVDAVDAVDAGEARQRQRAREVSVDRGADVADAHGGGREVSGERHSDAACGASDGRARGYDADRLGAPAAHAYDPADERKRARTAPGARSEAPTDSDGARVEGAGRTQQTGGGSLCVVVHDAHALDAHGVAGSPPAALGGRPGTLDGLGTVERAERLHRVDWGDYRPAIERHAHVLGRPAPEPTDERGRLAVPFVEWMQMLPAGWVSDLVLPNTDPRPERLSRTQALTALGNVVVTPQAVHAIKELLNR